MSAFFTAASLPCRPLRPAPESTSRLARRSKAPAPCPRGEKEEEGPPLSTGPRFVAILGWRAGLPPNPARLPETPSEPLQRRGRGGDPSLESPFVHAAGQPA